jgi:hypothetical protein
MRRCFPIALGCAFALGAVEAGASALQVRYALVTVARQGPLGAVGTGTLDLLYPFADGAPISSAGAGLSVLPGPVALLDGTLRATSVQVRPTFPLFQLEIAWRLDLDAAVGTLLPGGTLRLPAIRGQGREIFHCKGLCSPYPLPRSQAITSLFEARTFLWSASNHLVGGALRASALVPHTFRIGGGGAGSGLTASLLVSSATEIERHVVPEPGSVSTTLGGLAALALVSARRRRARRGRATAIR